MLYFDAQLLLRYADLAEARRDGVRSTSIWSSARSQNKRSSGSVVSLTLSSRPSRHENLPPLLSRPLGRVTATSQPDSEWRRSHGRGLLVREDGRLDLGIPTRQQRS